MPSRLRGSGTGRCNRCISACSRLPRKSRPRIHSNDLILGAVGTLQRAVVAHRLEFEYSLDAMFEPCPVAAEHWRRVQGLRQVMR